MQKSGEIIVILSIPIYVDFMQCTPDHTDDVLAKGDVGVQLKSESCLVSLTRFRVKKGDASLFSKDCKQIV